MGLAAKPRISRPPASRFAWDLLFVGNHPLHINNCSADGVEQSDPPVWEHCRFKICCVSSLPSRSRANPCLTGGCQLEKSIDEERARLRPLLSKQDFELIA